MTSRGLVGFERHLDGSFWATDQNAVTLIHCSATGTKLETFALGPALGFVNPRGLALLPMPASLAWVAVGP